jgi:diguanylate cyclase (GGDEF)-like protein
MVSIIPMLVMMLTYLSFLERSLEHEVNDRLTAARTGVEIELREREGFLLNEIERHVSQPILISTMTRNQLEFLEGILTHFLQLSQADLIHLFDKSGKPILGLQKLKNENLEPFKPLRTSQTERVNSVSNFSPYSQDQAGEGFIFGPPSTPLQTPPSIQSEIIRTTQFNRLSPEIMEKLSKNGEAIIRNQHPEGIHISVFKIFQFSGQTLGVLQEGMLLDQNFLDSLKKRTGLEVALINPQGNGIISSFHPVDHLNHQENPKKIAVKKIGGTGYFYTLLPIGPKESPVRVALFESKNALTASKTKATGFFFIIFGMITAVVMGASFLSAKAITQQQNLAEEALEASRASFRNVVEKSGDGIIIVDMEQIIRFVNPYSRLFFENKMTVFPGKPFNFPVVPNEPKEIEIIRISGGIGVGEMLTVETEWNGKPAHLISIRDITDRKKAEELIEHQAYHDALTMLPNRLLFIDRLNQELARCGWKKQPVGVIFLDLDQFKQINDTLGHTIGDFLLQAVAKRLAGCTREGDTIARLGGDEFTILLADLATTQDIPKIALKILEIFLNPFELKDHELYITSSMGISIFPNDGRDSETLLKNADTAMYRAKENGRNNYQFYIPEMNTRVSERLALENGLRRALERNEFILHYQPQVNLSTGQIVGMEALIRWNHPEKGLISPYKFIPLAEETGLIVPIGDWVIRTACAVAKAMQSVGNTGIKVAINLSARQFLQRDLIQKIDSALNKSFLDPKYLELELTESMIQNAVSTHSTLKKLNSMGIQISIDDFGTGYSSLSYLSRFPISKLKIDKSFVHDITTNPDHSSIVAAIITLAHNLNLKTIAEGVETLDQMNYLKSIQCDEIQGFVFSPPLPPDEIMGLLSQRSPLKILPR